MTFAFFDFLFRSAAQSRPYTEYESAGTANQAEADSR